MDEKDNFVYDYVQYTPESTYKLYAYGINESLEEESYTIICDNKKCSAEISDGKIRLVCPKGQSCMVTVTHKESGISDSVRIHSYGEGKEKLMDGQKNMVLFYRNNMVKQKYTSLNVIEQKYLALLTRVIEAYIYSV